MKVSKTSECQFHTLWEAQDRSGWMFADPRCTDDSLIIAEYVFGTDNSACDTFGYCPKCGTRLGFTEDGQPTEEPR